MNKKHTIVEIGACKGEHTKEFIKIKNANVWSFEPIPYLVNFLKNTYNVTNLRIIEKAVSNFNGVAKFHISGIIGNTIENSLNYGCSSLNNFSDDIKISQKKHKYWENRGDFNVVGDINVETIRMDTFINQNNIESIDYFHCDAQGNDLIILKSFGDKLNIIKYGVVEAANIVNL